MVRSTSYRPTDSTQGRTMRQCEAIYTSMLQGGFSPGIMRSASVRETGSSSVMRRPVQPEVAFFGGRQIQPRPQMASLDTMLLNEPTEPPRKKRGRPTNEDRQRAAIARGEPWPPPPKRERTMSAVAGPSTARPSSTAILAAQAVMTPPPQQQQQQGAEAQSAETSGSSSGKRKRGRPTKAEQGLSRLQESAIVSPPPQPTPSRYPDILTRDEPPLPPRTNPGSTQSSRPDELGMR